MNTELLAIVAVGAVAGAAAAATSAPLYQDLNKAHRSCDREECGGVAEAQTAVGRLRASDQEEPDRKRQKRRQRSLVLVAASPN